MLRPHKGAVTRLFTSATPSVTAPQGGRNQVVYQCHPFMGVFNLIATSSRGGNIRFSAFLPVVYGTGKAFSRERKRYGIELSRVSTWLRPPLQGRGNKV